ncbi:hypothetical protein HanXRQr2_Chr13g0586621 [Helianthus annuus]|uniref:Uncharacterized protein n=1 Tax=Helianthus annuus TaxID=4232 RepID=A0A9K3EJS7_HELAN|nr:hypothetical protein HanXRQr2_Chr13g0586621 [Helianthus annuus]KAJ0849076.1 hypothetical protein HanPSC8_Chr13g0564791 [Helianthus annuus]
MIKVFAIVAACSQKSMQKMHHYQKTPAPEIFLNELAMLTIFFFQDVLFSPRGHNELEGSCSAVH